MSKNCQKLEIFVEKIAKNVHFFNKITNRNFWEKMIFFLFFFLFKSQVFDNFLTFKLQFSGGSGTQLYLMMPAQSNRIQIWLLTNDFKTFETGDVSIVKRVL